MICSQVKDIYLHPDPFSVQNGLLTPTLKTKRPQLKAYFKPQLEDLYQNLDWRTGKAMKIKAGVNDTTHNQFSENSCQDSINNNNNNEKYCLRL